jgi:hypothetical protein
MGNYLYLSTAEEKLLLRLRQLRKGDPREILIRTYPLEVNATGSWEAIEDPWRAFKPRFSSGSIAY